MSSQAPSTRLILGAALLIVGVAAGEGSLTGERIECVRSRQTCVLERGSPLSAEPARTIPLADVAKVEFREREARGGPRGATVLLSTSGAELHVAGARLEPARLHHARLAAFFRGEGEVLEIASETRPWVARACFALAAFGLYQLVTGLLALRRGRANGPASGGR